MNNQIQWRTRSEYVDTETGEIITAETAKQQYTITKKKQSYELKKTTGIRTITNECRRTNQTELFTNTKRQNG